METTETQRQLALQPSWDEPYAVFFIVHITEEKDGRPLPGLPTKVMGSDPSVVGQQVAKLIRHRYPEAIPNSVAKMPRTKMLTIELKSSYLVLHFELPPVHIACKNRKKAFSRFSTCLETELTSSTVDDRIIRRRRKKYFNRHN